MSLVNEFPRKIKVCSEILWAGSVSFLSLPNAVMLIAGAVMLYKGIVNITVFLMFVIFSSEFYKPFSKMGRLLAGLLRRER